MQFDRFVLALMLAFFGTAASAQDARLVQKTVLRASASAEAPAVGQAAVGETVRLLEMKAGWARVRQGTVTAWVRAGTLDTTPAAVAAAAAVETGRRSSGNEVVALGVRAFPPPRANRHALLIGVGTYVLDPARRVEGLPGVAPDVGNALLIARLLQVPIEQTTVLLNEAVTRAGVAAALEELQARMNVGDRVFVYWAGHGSRYFEASEGGCVESLVTHDLEDISNRLFAQWIKPLGLKADKLLVMFDACHSAGLSATRSLNGFQPRSAGIEDVCQVPSNVRTRSLASAVRDAGLGAGDVVHVASARADEVSYEDAATGGLATRAMRECLGGDAVDVDGSGAITMAEVAACVQAKVESRLAPYPLLGVSHLTLSGNASFVPAAFAAPVPEAPAVEPARASLAQVVNEVFEQRDPKWKVEAVVQQPRVRIGETVPGWRITSSRDGYLYVAMVGSDMTSLHLLFPNDLARDNRVKGGEPVVLPGPRWQLRAGGPPGQDHVLVIVADGPRDLNALEGPKPQPFVTPLVDARGRVQLQRVLLNNARVAGGGCQGTSGCSDAFGAALFSIEEIE